MPDRLTPQHVIAVSYAGTLVSQVRYGQLRGKPHELLRHHLGIRVSRIHNSARPTAPQSPTPGLHTLPACPNRHAGAALTNDLAAVLGCRAHNDRAVVLRQFPRERVAIAGARKHPDSFR